MPFQKYMHIERFGADEVQGIELGECYVFPKLDGTNGSIWNETASVWDPDIRCGSRNRELSIENDNAGFCKWVGEQKKYKELLTIWPDFIMYGEWLVPHSLKTYREDSWRKFYVFDVYSRVAEKYLPFGEYEPILKSHGIDYIPPICVIRNAAYDNLLKELDNNTFLIQEGKGVGEGIVIKNYGYANKFGRTVWAKMVHSKYKEARIEKSVGGHEKPMIEQAIVDEFCTKHLVDKTYAKIVNENEGWNSRYIPRLLGTVFHDLVTEEIWEAVKKLKLPTVNFKTLNSLTIMKIKEFRPELF